jgi:RHS repeat-associated protein
VQCETSSADQTRRASRTRATRLRSRGRALRDPHVRRSRRLGDPARAQAKPSTDGPCNAAHRLRGRRAFGQVTEDTSPGFQPFGFAGGLYDAQTRLVHFGAREYDASIGRWISKDPIGFDGGQANLFVYVGNDPVNTSDPSGLEAIPAFGCTPDPPPDCVKAVQECGNQCQNLKSSEASDCSACCTQRYFDCKKAGISITAEQSCRDIARRRK